MTEIDHARTEAVRPAWQRVLFGSRPMFTGIRILCLVALATFLFGVLLVPIRVTGNSMYPTYRDGQINFVNRYSYKHAPPQRGDVVALKAAGEQMLLLKRIIGLPGETIALRGGRILIDGRAYQDQFSGNPVSQLRKSQKLGDDEYFVIGDNRRISELYFIQRWQIVGKLLF